MNTDTKIIRFIDSECRTLFHITDGGSIRITYPPDDGREPVTHVCKYRDETHTQIGNGMYNIRQFAERMEAIGAKYELEAQLRSIELTPFAADDTPMKLPAAARTNSLAVLTTREPYIKKDERIVFAVFLVDYHEEGNDDSEGPVHAHHRYRVNLTPDESRKVLLWDYYANPNSPYSMKWGSGLNMQFYFPDPHAPWQRGTNENTNGLLREYLPKSFDIALSSESDIADFVEKLNYRPRKCLGWKTPHEVFFNHSLYLT